MTDSECHREFLWGVATSAFQIEGGIANDMTEWENRGRFKQDGKDPRIGNAVDHWHRWRSDFDLLEQLGVNSYRLSLEWARIEPEMGRFDQTALDQYRRMIDNLLERGITPMLTLLHFSHPRWFHHTCPWHKRSAIDHFLLFAEVVARRLLPEVPLVVTLNEPMVWLLAAYGDAKFPPGMRDLNLMMTALHNMLTAHRGVYDLLRTLLPRTQVGIANNFIIFRRARAFSRADREVTRVVDHVYNQMISDAFATNRLSANVPLILNYDQPIKLDNRIDFWGINYYCRLRIRFRLNPQRPFDMLYVPHADHGASDLGWEIYPRGLMRACRRLAATGKPLYITENGIAASDDRLRIDYLNKHLAQVQKIRRRGINLRGYYHWSLMDNYEWLEGTDARFGLVRVDYDNDLRRELKPSAHRYAEYIESTR